MSASTETETFPPLGGINHILFHRHNLLVDNIVADITNSCRSLYFRGPKSCGKSILLHLIGTALLKKGVKVLRPTGIAKDDFEAIMSISEEHFKATGKDTVVLIDEFQSYSKWNFHAINFILKSTTGKLSHVRVVAYGIHMMF